MIKNECANRIGWIMQSYRPGVANQPDYNHETDHIPVDVAAANKWGLYIQIFHHGPWKMHMVLTDTIIDNRMMMLYNGVKFATSEWFFVIKDAVKRKLIALQISSAHTENYSAITLGNIINYIRGAADVCKICYHVSTGTTHLVHVEGHKEDV